MKVRAQKAVDDVHVNEFREGGGGGVTLPRIPRVDMVRGAAGSEAGLPKWTGHGHVEVATHAEDKACSGHRLQ